MAIANLKMSDDVEKATDTLGGGGALDTNIYPIQVKVVYLGKSKGGALSATIVGKLEDGSDFKSTQWITSGDAKGNKPYYERNGKKYPLPGYSVVDDLCRLASGTALGDAEMEENMVNIYDFDKGKDIPTEVDCIVGLEDETVMLAIQKQLEDKNADDGTGKFVPTGETRTTNEVSKVFSADGATYLEISDELEVEFGQKWLDKNKGKVRDRTSKDAGASGAPKKAAKKAMFT